jgi:hypothetical protein
MFNLTNRIFIKVIWNDGDGISCNKESLRELMVYVNCRNGRVGDGDWLLSYLIGAMRDGKV